MIVFPSLEVLQLDIVRFLRRLLIQSNRYLPLYRLNGVLYGLMQKLVVVSLSKVPGVRSIYLSHGPTVGETFPGLSDFDLVIVYDQSITDFPSLLRHKWLKLKKYLPARDIVCMDAADFEEWHECGGGEDLSNLGSWRLLFGSELRIAVTAPDSAIEFDKVRNCLGYYWQLSQSVIKEAGYQPFLAIFERRQLYKFFCYSVLPLYGHTGKSTLYQHLMKWSEKFGDAAGFLLLKWREKRFFDGKLSQERYHILAHAIWRIDLALLEQKIFLAPDYSTDKNSSSDQLSTTYADVREHLKPFVENFASLCGDFVRSVRVSGNGSPRGWRLFVVVRDGMTIPQYQEFFRLLAITFRTHDDPWFNEHFPLPTPIVYTEAMFCLHLRLWPEDAHYVANFPANLYGEPFSEVTIFRPSLDRELFESGERLAFKRYLDQIFLERSRAGLYESVTLYYPRIYVKHKIGVFARTTEEAISIFERTYDGPERTLPRELFQRFGQMQLEEIRKGIRESDFVRASLLFSSKFPVRAVQAGVVNL